jgi:enamine deaminase RidA (YjgF/YER057c/UK114 family)
VIEPGRAADELLRTWQERLTVVTRNANELSEAEFTKRIRNRLREGRYVGLTLERAQAALEALGSLMDDYLLLARVIEEAIDADQCGFLWSREARDDKVRALLEGPSIERPTLHVPLQQRGLLGAAQQHDRLTPQAVLAAMEDAFAQARDTLIEIDAVEQHGVSDLAELRSDHAAMAQRARLLQAADDRPSFVVLQQRPDDPLATREAIASLRRSLQAWSNRLSELEQARAAAQSGVASAQQGLAGLMQLVEARAHQVESLRGLLGHDAAASMPSAAGLPLATLATWCEAIDNSLRKHDWRAVKVGLSRFKPALDEAIAAEQQQIAAAEARRAEVDELQGRFRALKAKEQVLRDRGTLPGSCAELRSRLDLALAPRPLDIDALRRALRAYQSLLASGHR